MGGELKYAHPPRCSSTALPYTKQLKCRLSTFCFWWQLLTTHQWLIRHFGCFTSFVIFLMALSFQSERHWIQAFLSSPITYSHASRESTSRIMVPLQVLPPVAVTTDIYTFRDCVYHIFMENWQGSYFSFPVPAVRVALVHWEALTLLLYMLHTQSVLSRLQLTAWKHLNLHITNTPLQYMGLFLW